MNAFVGSALVVEYLKQMCCSNLALPGTPRADVTGDGYSSGECLIAIRSQCLTLSRYINLSQTSRIIKYVASTVETVLN